MPRDTLTLTLPAAIERALEVSPEVDQREAQRKRAEARRDEARASRFLTEFNATTGHAFGPGLDIPESNMLPNDALYLNPEVRNDWEHPRPINQLEVEALQPIWTWGELSGSIRAARYGIRVEAAEVEATALEVAYRTGELYYNLLLTEALARVADEAGGVVQRARDEVQRLLDEGAEDVDDADLFQVRITEQDYRRRVVEVTQQRQTARVALTRQLFFGGGTFVVPAADQLQPIGFERDSLAVYLDLALASRPEIQQAEAGLAARQALLEVAQSDYFPKLFMRGTARYTYTYGRFRQPNPYVSDPYFGQSVRVGVGLRQELNFLQTNARVEQARAQRNEVRYQMEGARQLVLFQVEEAYRQLVIAEAAMEAQDEALLISKEWLRTEQINFDLDLGDTENLIDAVRANLELQVRYYEAVKNYNVAVLRLLRRTGTLIERVQSGILVE